MMPFRNGVIQDAAPL